MWNESSSRDQNDDKDQGTDEKKVRIMKSMK
jgi:hypothetical protein